MKYVLLNLLWPKDLPRVVPVVFPDIFNHDDMALYAAEALRVSLGQPGARVDVVSAGFVDASFYETHGKSVTLGLPSRPQDASVINAYDYTHGL